MPGALLATRRGGPGGGNPPANILEALTGVLLAARPAEGPIRAGSFAMGSASKEQREMSANARLPVHGRTQQLSASRARQPAEQGPGGDSSQDRGEAGGMLGARAQAAPYSYTACVTRVLHEAGSWAPAARMRPCWRMRVPGTAQGACGLGHATSLGPLVSRQLGNGAGTGPGD